MGEEWRADFERMSLNPGFWSRAKLILVLAQVGAIINGNDVIAYGLKAEHSLTDQARLDRPCFLRV